MSFLVHTEKSPRALLHQCHQLKTLLFIPPAARAVDGDGSGAVSSDTAKSAFVLQMVEGELVQIMHALGIQVSKDVRSQLLMVRIRSHIGDVAYSINCFRPFEEDDQVTVVDLCDALSLATKNAQHRESHYRPCAVM
jgi:hypothetical protein